MNAQLSKNKAIMWMILWSVSHVCSMSINKHLSHSIPIPLVLFFRTLFGLLFFLPFFIKEKGYLQLKTQRPSLQAVRIALVIASMCCTYFAYRHLPLAQATSLGFTGPLVTTLFTALFLKEHINVKRWGLIILGYCGVLVMINPFQESAQIILPFAVTSMLFANIFASGAIICMKRLSALDSKVTLMSYMTLSSFLVAAVLVPFVWKPIEISDIVLLAVIGGLGSLSQFSYLSAITNASPSFVSPFEYTRLVVAIPIGIFFFQETPTLWTLLGGLIIIVASWIISREKGI